MQSHFKRTGSDVRVLILALGLLTCSLARAQRGVGSAEGFHSSSTTTARLSLDEKVGQLLQVRVLGDYKDFNDPDYLAIRNQIRKYHIGSVCLAARMNGPNLVKGSPSQVAKILNQVQQESTLPLLVGADLERGLASRLSDVPDFPFPMALGAVSEPHQATRFGATVAEQARAVGIHLAYAPVADLNSNPDSPVINTRAFGEDPDQVGELVAAYIRGAHEHGMIVSAKHFPGQGEPAADSHIGIVRIDGDRTHLDKVELAPFRRAIEAGVDSVLLAHALVPAIDPDPNRIATNSPKIVNRLLKEELGFRGLVITDALEMRAVAELYRNEPDPYGRAAVDAIKAGADILVLPENLSDTYHGIVRAVRSGEIPESRIDESVRKILAVKAALGLDKNRFVDVEAVTRLFSKRDSYDFAQRVSDQAVTLIRYDGSSLPISKSEKKRESIVLISFTDSAVSRLGHRFEEEFKARRPDAKVLHWYHDRMASDLDPGSLPATLKEADQVVVAAFVTHVPGRKIMAGGKAVTAFGMFGPSAQVLSDILSNAADKTVVVALGSPYLIQNYPAIKNYICTYSVASTSEASAVKALFGEIQNEAKLPVTLPGVAERGSAIPWPGKERGER